MTPEIFCTFWVSCSKRAFQKERDRERPGDGLQTRSSSSSASVCLSADQANANVASYVPCLLTSLFFLLSPPRKKRRKKKRWRGRIQIERSVMCAHLLLKAKIE
ncbi:hypothetical protein NPIL_530281 [Nephila pilipes]|uniref:Uncharacterized protein n=1 Tax=Nephila pilipes TaxID=299642 RepID=A0A8X6MQW4_NEPPI|nr:hypothetical protein NPIL_530281 [Nephila pilipes]